MHNHMKKTLLTSYEAPYASANNSPLFLSRAKSFLNLLPILLE